jgi:hypothetical protein
MGDIMKRIRLALMLLLAGLPLAAPAKTPQAGPPVPYVHKGACPFEGCTYGEWTANADTAIHKDKDAKSPVLFTIRKGDKVTGVTGEVVTVAAGVGVASRTIQLDETHVLKPGETYYVLHSVGEGYMAVWVRGKVYEADLSEDKFKKQPKTEWWVQVKRADGQMGWTTETRNFDGIDSLG